MAVLSSILPDGIEEEDVAVAVADVSGHITCTLNGFKDTNGNHPCMNCGQNAIAVRNRTTCECIEGYMHKPGEDYDCFRKSSFGMCPQENITNSRTSYAFPESMVTATAILLCSGNDSVVKRHCSISRITKRAAWDDPDWSKCKEKEFFTIEELTKIEIDERNVVVVAQTLSNVTSNADEISTAETLSDVTTVMENCLKISSVDNKEIAKNVLNSINNVMRVNRTITTVTTNLNKRVLDIIDEVAKKARDDPISFSGESFGFGSTKQDGSQTFKGVVTQQKDLDKDFCNSKLGIGFTKGISNEQDIESINVADITIPEAVFHEKGITETNVYVYTFKNDNLFPVQDNQTTREESVASYILATSLFNESLQGLDHPITINFKVKSIVEARRGKCSFWKMTSRERNNTLDEVIGHWSTEGCNKAGFTTDVTGNIHIVCKCTHLTNFAVLFNVHGEKLEEIKSQYALNIVTFIGCTLSMVSLLATLVCYLGASEMRRRTTQRILINFCFSLLSLLITFTFGINQSSRPPLCHAIATVLHFLTLSTFAWMSVQGVFLYKKSVRATKNRGESKRTYRISFIMAWGLPIIIACTTCYFSIPQFNGKNPNQFCVITGMLFNISTLAPVTFLILVNFVLFLPVIIKIQKHMTIRSRLSKLETSMWRRLKVTLSCSTLLGLTWVFGLLAVDDLRIPFQWLFCLTNSLQGFLIFIFHVVLNEKLRNAWRKIILPNSRTSSTSDASRTNQYRIRNGTLTSYHRASTKCTDRQLSLNTSSTSSEK